MYYFWWGRRGNLTLITLRSERVKTMWLQPSCLCYLIVTNTLYGLITFVQTNLEFSALQSIPDKSAAYFMDCWFPLHWCWPTKCGSDWEVIHTLDSDMLALVTKLFQFLYEKTCIPCKMEIFLSINDEEGELFVPPVAIISAVHLTWNAVEWRSIVPCCNIIPKRWSQYQVFHNGASQILQVVHTRYGYDTLGKNDNHNHSSLDLH